MQLHNNPAIKKLETGLITKCLVRRNYVRLTILPYLTISYLFNDCITQVISRCGYPATPMATHSQQRSISKSTVAQFWVKGSSTQLLRPLSATFGTTLKRSGTTSSSLRGTGDKWRSETWRDFLE